MKMDFKTPKIERTLWEVTENIAPVANARIAAAIVYKRQIVSLGVNQAKSHPIQKKYAKNEDAIFLHAEINAIRQASNVLTLDEFKKSDIIIVRRRLLNVAGLPLPHYGLAKPCPGCMKAIKDFGIKNIWYSLDEKHGLTRREMRCEHV